MRGLDELDGEQELDCADEETAEVEAERDGAQRERHVVQDAVLRRRQELELVLGRLLARSRRYFEEEDERKKCQEQRHETQKSERRDHALDAGLPRHVHELGDVGRHQRRAELLPGRVGDVQASVGDGRRVVTHLRRVVAPVRSLEGAEVVVERRGRHVRRAH